MKNFRFWVICTGLTGAVGIAVVSLGAQSRQAPVVAGRVELQPESRPFLSGRLPLDSGDIRLGVVVSDLDAGADGRDKAPANGVRIDEVTPSSPADKAGLKAGDIVVDFDGERIRSARQFARLVRETADGRAVQLGVLRDGKQQTLEATPERQSFGWNPNIDGDLRRRLERGLRDFRQGPPLEFEFRTDPDDPRRFEFHLNPDAPPMARASSGGRLGVTVLSLAPQLAAYFGVPDGGALVATVTKDSAADKAGIQAGDVITTVNGDRVRDSGSLMRKIGDAGGTELTMVIVRDRKGLTVKATVERPRRARGTTGY